VQGVATWSGAGARRCPSRWAQSWRTEATTSGQSRLSTVNARGAGRASTRSRLSARWPVSVHVVGSLSVGRLRISELLHGRRKRIGSGEVHSPPGTSPVPVPVLEHAGWSITMDEGYQDIERLCCTLSHVHQHMRRQLSALARPREGVPVRPGPQPPVGGSELSLWWLPTQTARASA
jgi:hypothetical protein